jgi:hypothetical protein
MPDSITPSPELVTSLRNSAPHGIRDAGVTRELWLINHAYAAGADQELEACCKWTAIVGGADALRAARRPKPPTLKDQALALINRRIGDGYVQMLTGADAETIRTALEALDD